MAREITSKERWRDIACTVLRNRRRSVDEIVSALEREYGDIDQVIGGDELYPSDTTWYFTAPNRLR